MAAGPSLSLISAAAPCAACASVLHAARLRGVPGLLEGRFLRVRHARIHARGKPSGRLRKKVPQEKNRLLQSTPMLAALARPHRIKQSHRRRRRIASGVRDYNYFRDYEAGTGRYVESDPAGFDGGINTYGYVGANPLGSSDPLGLWVKICNRLLGGPKSSPTWKHNPFRHEYLDVSGSFFGFTSGANPHLFGLFSDGGRDKDESDGGRCTPYCMDDKFDKYVLDAIAEVGYPKYFGLGFFGNGDTFGINCQRWVNLVLSKAKRAYLEHEKCPTCFK